MTKKENFEAVRRIHQIPTRTLEEAYEKPKPSSFQKERQTLRSISFPTAARSFPLNADKKSLPDDLEGFSSFIMVQDIADPFLLALGDLVFIVAEIVFPVVR